VLASLRRRRWLHLAVANTRILIAFAFLPAGLKKVTGQPFTDAGNSGAFHDFLHAFHATGLFYGLVGAVQLTAAALLVSQYFALLGAVIALPVLAAILAFCWSTGVVPTAIVVTLMTLATLALIAWDGHRLRGLVVDGAAPPAPWTAPIATGLWAACGIAVCLLYLAACAITGEVYRPRGSEPHELGFWVLAVMPALPLVTLALDIRRHRASRPGADHH
jgi:uncharacterized membrane protein YphA (DoxX/SURF4 family)